MIIINDNLINTRKNKTLSIDSTRQQDNHKLNIIFKKKIPITFFIDHRLRAGYIFSLKSWDVSCDSLVGVYMTPGRRSRRGEFTPVPSHRSTFFYMIPSQGTRTLY